MKRTYFMPKNWFALTPETRATVFVGIIALSVISILMLISYWKIYVKMGIPGWLSLIPIYGQYVFYKKLGCRKLYWFIFAVSFAYGFWTYYALRYNLAQTLTSVYLAVEIIILVVLTLLDFGLMGALSEEFGHGAGFVFGLVLLPYIFIPILGLGDSKYLGYADEDYHGDSE